MNLKCKIVSSFIFGCISTIIALEGISRVIVWISGYLLGIHLHANAVFQAFGCLLSIVFSGLWIGKTVRSSKQTITIAGGSIPNIFYDIAFEDLSRRPESDIITDNIELKKENKGLKKENSKIKKDLEKCIEDFLKEREAVIGLAYTADIFIRHHINTSRLIRSLIQLWKEGKECWLWEFCNNILDECVTTLTKDRADKSSSIYFINNDELRMFTYNRIEFLSSRERKFRKGEGFVGSIWQKNKPEIIENIVEDQRFRGQGLTPRNGYGSLLGHPIRVGKEVVGVLCIQSEMEKNFVNDDLIMVSFYADICGLAKKIFDLYSCKRVFY